jgi:hypothetical protein
MVHLVMVYGNLTWMFGMWNRTQQHETEQLRKLHDFLNFSEYAEKNNYEQPRTAWNRLLPFIYVETILAIKTSSLFKQIKRQKLTFNFPFISDNSQTLKNPSSPVDTILSDIECKEFMYLACANIVQTFVS